MSKSPKEALIDKHSQRPSTNSEDDELVAKRKAELKATNKRALRKLVVASIVSLFFIAVQLAGGILSGSIAIFTDTAHLASDIIGFAISIACLFAAQRPATKVLSYGYHRAEVIGTLASIIIIWVLTIWLLSEATKRFFTEPKVIGSYMLITAVLGLFFNLIQIKILHSHDGHFEIDHDEEAGHSHGHNHGHHGHGHHHHGHSHGPSTKTEGMHTDNINVESALLHVIGDMVMSIGVVVAAIIIYFVPEADFIDPICTYIFSVIVIVTTVPVMKDCVHVLMEGTPTIVDSEQLYEDIANADGVEEVHDFHVWSISVGKLSLTCHIKSDRFTDSLNAVTEICRKKYGITHTTV